MPEPPGTPFTEFIGAMLDEAGEGYSRLTLTCGPDHLGLDGHVHGGILTALMDSSVGIAISRLRGTEARRRAPHATIEMNTTFLARADEGDDLVVEGRITLSTDAIVTGESEVRLASGKVLARGRLTFAIIRRSG
ncbi:MAG TPA: PaaI family thioesterase [Dehalococcoidia bacterium]|nr:PaaI family thioesterase [Dehalococcoidia bacterium]